MLLILPLKVSVDNGSNYVKIANTISVPADATLVVVGKDNGFYLDETDLLAVTASANSDNILSWLRTSSRLKVINNAGIQRWFYEALMD